MKQGPGLVGVAMTLLQTLLLSILGAFTFIGIACVFWVVCAWRSIGKQLPELWPKLVTEGIQILVALVALGAAFATTVDKEGWLPSAVTGAVCLGVFKLLQVLVDNRVKAADKVDKAELERAIREATLRTRLLTTLRFAVGRKVRRLQRAVGRRGS